MATYNSLDHIISSVRSSNLNFTYQETPFSLYLTIRKTSIKKHQSNGSESSQMGDVVALETENLVLKSCIRDLEGKLSAFNKDTCDEELCNEGMISSTPLLFTANKYNFNFN